MSRSSATSWQDVRAHEKTRTAIYERGSKIARTAYVVRVFTDVGIVGEHLGGNASEYGGVPMFAKALIGRNALARRRSTTTPSTR